MVPISQSLWPRRVAIFSATSISEPIPIWKRMVRSIGLLTKEELRQLLAELREIYAMAERGEFVIEEGVEDVHSQVELMLTRNLGDIGKKIHSGRSRNDQVLLDLKLFTRAEIKEVAVGCKRKNPSLTTLAIWLSI